MVLQEYETYLAQMYLQTLLEAESQQPLQQLADTASASQSAVQDSASSVSSQEALPQPQAAAAQPDTYAKLKRLVRF